MLTTVNGTPKKEGISRSSPDNRTLSPSAATVAARMMRTSREGTPSNADQSTNGVQSNSSISQLAFNNLIEQMNNNNNNMNGITASATTTNASSSNTCTNENTNGLTTSNTNGFNSVTNNKINGLATIATTLNASSSNTCTNDNTNGLTTTATTSNANGINSATINNNNTNGNNGDLLSTFNRTQCVLPTVIANMGITNPLVISPTPVTIPELCQVSPVNQVTVAVNGQSSSRQIPPLPTHSFSPLTYPVMPFRLPINTHTSASQYPDSSRLESPLTNRSQTSNDILASISNIVSLLSPSIFNMGSEQFLAACTPLLQIAVKQAIIDCISTCGKISVQGQLEVTVTGTSSNQATVVLNFDDLNTTSSGQSSPPAGQVTSPQGDHRCSPQGQIGSIFQTTELNSDNDRTLLDSEGRQVSTASDFSMASSSHRKRSSPSKVDGEDDIDQVTEPKKPRYLSPVLPQPAIPDNGVNTETLSSPTPLAVQTTFNGGTSTSPPLSATSLSGDSGVLDLSRGASVETAEPVTPTGNLIVKTEANPFVAQLNDTNKNGSGPSPLEMFRILTTQCYGSLQNGMNTTNMTDVPNLLTLSLFHLAQQQQQHLASSVPTLHQQLSQSILPTTSQPSLPTGQPMGNGVTSASPVVKTVRRQRLSTGTTRGPTDKVPIVHRSTSSRRFPCNQCLDEFPSLNSLEEHTVNTHGSYRCQVCQAQFTQRSNLQRHALKHVGFKPFECGICSKGYYRKDHLMRHMEMAHPGVPARDHIIVHLTSSESLEYLNRTGTSEEGNGASDSVELIDSASTGNL